MSTYKRTNGNDEAFENDYNDLIGDFDTAVDEEVQMPSRSILETDSAKYAAEYIKEVVKDLYTADPKAYVEKKESEPPREARPAPKPDRAAPPAGAGGYARSDQRTPHKPSRVKVSKGIPHEKRPAPYAGRDYGQAAGQAGGQVAGQASPQAATQTNRPARAAEASGYARKNTRQEERTFSSLRETEDMYAPSASARSTRRTGKNVGPQTGEFRTMRNGDEEYVYLKDVLDTGEFEPVSGETKAPAEAPERKRKTFRSAEKAVEPEEVNRGLEQRLKAAVRPEEPSESEESAAGGRFQGINLFAAVFMMLAVLVIGALVWKINSLSGEGAASGQATADAALTQQMEALTTQNNDLQKQLADLTAQVTTLTDENKRLIQTATETAASSDASVQRDEDADSNSDNADANSGTTEYYTVQRGDTLWGISQQFLGDGNLYKKIAEANNIDAEKPLVSGTKLKIPK